MSQTKTRSSRASQWAAEAEGIELTLPSGKTILARRAGLPYMLQLGLVPDSLGPIVTKMIAVAENKSGPKVEAVAEAEIGKLDPMQQFKLLGQLYDATLVACAVDPVFVEAVTDPETQAPVSAVSFQDKEAIFSWAQGGLAPDLSNFRPGQGGPVGAAPQGEGLRPAPVGPAGDRPAAVAAPGV